MNSYPAFNFNGSIGEALDAVTQNWLLRAPGANPAMLEMFLDRDIQPYRDQVPWAGEFAGKYLTSAVQVLRCTGDSQLREYLGEFVKKLLSCQDVDGYLGPWSIDSRLTNASYHHTHPEIPPGEPLRTWDTWGHYHIMIGLLLWDETVGDPDALSAACRIADLICDQYLGDKQPRLVETGFNEMNLAPAHALAILHRKTGNASYLAMAVQIVEEFATIKGDENLAGDYLNQALDGKEFFEMPKPRWESLHPIMALAELYIITGEGKYRQAFEHIWWSIQKNDRHNNGGFSSGEQATGNPFDPRPIETCCTIAWMALSVEMLKLTLDSHVADELELSMFNSILGMHHFDGRWATYNTPSDGLRFASAHQIVFQARPGSPELNCCSVNSPRGLGLLSDWAVIEKSGEIYLNYYGPGKMIVPWKNQLVIELFQETTYPLSGRVKLFVRPEQPVSMKLHLRIPGWSKTTRVMINGEAMPGVKPGAYLAIQRRWLPGDVIDLDFDFSPHFWFGERDCLGKASVYLGPVLLAYDLRYNRHEKDLRSGDSQTYGLEPWKDPGQKLSVPRFPTGPLTFKPITWDDWFPPHLLLEVDLPGGKKAYLCDFASAGQTGTPYHSWLPI